MSSPESSDSELRQAIALSLEASQSSPTRKDSSIDSEFERAIALSLQDTRESIDTKSPSKISDCCVISDSEIEESITSHTLPQAGVQRHEQPANDHTSRAKLSHGIQPRRSNLRAENHDSQAPTIKKGILGISDRRRMEEERLARAAKKRKASSSTPQPCNRQSIISQDDSSASAAVNELEIAQRPIKRINISVPNIIMDSTPSALVDSIPGIYGAPTISSKAHKTPTIPLPQMSHHMEQVDLLKPGVHFLEGVVKKTWAQGYARENDIKIDEILQKNDLKFAVLSAFQWDTEWILRKLDLGMTRLVCVVQAESEEEKARMRGNVPPSIRFCFPSMAGQINCMHSKLMLLSHPTHLRIVIPTANLVPYDWGEAGGIMENTVFLIDLPRLSEGGRANVDELTPFHRELRYFLKAMEMDQSVIDSMSKFDFAQTARYAFVHSIGGSHSGSSWKRTGYSGLGSAVQNLGLATEGPLELDFVSASIGSLNLDFLKALYLAAKGDDGTLEYNRRYRSSTEKAATKIPTPEENNTYAEVERHFRICFPTKDVVVGSKGGIGSGGTICFQSRWYDSPGFPKSMMRDCKSMRQGLLMHNKIIFARPHQPLIGNSDSHTSAWAYIGSANLSESAWGKLVKDRIAKLPKMNCRNWECGVIVPVSSTNLKQQDFEEQKKMGEVEKKQSSPPGMEIFDGVVPVPMKTPCEEYGRKRPWFYTET
jgi:hypothetical protein